MTRIQIATYTFDRCAYATVCIIGPDGCGTRITQARAGSVADAVSEAIRQFRLTREDRKRA